MKVQTVIKMPLIKTLQSVLNRDLSYNTKLFFLTLTDYSVPGEIFSWK